MDDNREVIELVNKLQGYAISTGCEIPIDFPQIVVVGAQSSGKSSVLDGLMGCSILPRGSGTVTKCPIIVQLRTITDPNDEGVEFPDAPDEGRIIDYDHVRDMIAERMNADDGAITDKPVIIRVFRQDVVTLTVVDLPGIKKLASSGEQDDIGNLTVELSQEYISKENAIILAVSPANYDICNSDGIQLAKEADPNGHRTIGVLTKLDLMDEGTNARDLLTGNSKDVNVKLGMIGLVNRSQKDIDNDMTVEQQLAKEKEFLEKNYPDLASLNGVPYLRKRLHELLVKHILQCLPGIQRKMERLLEVLRTRIDGIPDVSTGTNKFRFASRIIQGFENWMKKEIEGCTRNPDYEHVYGGIKIKELFENKFARDMEKVGQNTDAAVTDEMILNAFRNSAGFDAMFVYPEAVFRKLAQEQIKHIEAPALKCAERVHDEIVKISDRFFQEQRNALDLFAELRRSIRTVVRKMLNDKLDLLRGQIVHYILTQASLVFSLDKTFINTLSKIRRALEKNLHGGEDSDSDTDLDSGVGAEMVPNLPQVNTESKMRNKLSMISKDKIFVKLKDPETIRLIKLMVRLYFHHIKVQVQDYIPKLVAISLITQFCSEEDGNLGTELRVHVMENHEQLVQLPANISEQRARDVNMRDHLWEVIGEIKALLSAYFDEDEYSEAENDSSDEPDV